MPKVRRNRSKEVENISQCVQELCQLGHGVAIQEWAQRVRSCEDVSTEEAVHLFQEALLDDNHYSSEDAKSLLRQLLRPKHLEAFRQTEGKPNRYEVPLSEERRLHWGELVKAERWEELHADQAALFENWLNENPDRAKELLQGFQESLPNLGTKPKSRYPTLMPDEAYHSSGLYWLAANVLVKLYGLDDRLATSMLRNLQKRWSSARYDRNLVQSASGEVFLDTHRQLAEKGAYAIKNLDGYLLHAIKNHILKSRASEYQRFVQGPEKSSHSGHWGESIAGPRSDWPDCSLALWQMIERLPDRYRPYVRFMVANPDATDQEVAAALQCSTRKIERLRKELRENNLLG